MPFLTELRFADPTEGAAVNVETGGIKLTELASCGGCAAKYSAARLEELLQGFVPVEAENLLVGLAPADAQERRADRTPIPGIRPGKAYGGEAIPGRIGTGGWVAAAFAQPREADALPGHRAASASRRRGD